MNEEKYYEQIESYIKKNEVNKKKRILEENYDTLKNNWEIGKLIVEAQGGEKRAKYGNELIKKWSMEFTKNYGKGYDESNLRNFRRFYLLFSKQDPMGLKLNWSQIRTIMPIKDENKRNYYINLCLENKLSKRELILNIKANSYERLINKPDKIEIINISNNISFLDNMKNPIIIKLTREDEIKNEQDLETTILAQLSFFLEQLGGCLTFAGNQYKLTENGINYYPDILLLNYKLNCFIVVELKCRKLKKEDKAQTEFYMNLVDKNLRQPYQNKTMGIIITKEQNQFVANFVRSESLIPLTYELQT